MNPSPDHASLVSSAQYSSGAAAPDRLDQDLAILAVQVISADREAVRLAFRLYSESDGHYSETLDIMLGRLIRIDPVLFLQELVASRRVKRLDSLLGNLGPQFVDRFQAGEYETEERTKALQSVQAPELRRVRDECVLVLQGASLE